MSRLFLFADEAGCLTFNRNKNVSKYFILCTVAMRSCTAANALMELRRDLAWLNFPLEDYFHATNDKQKVRDRVFNVIRQQDFEIYATIMEKSKARPHVRESSQRFYQYAWYYQFKYGINRAIGEHEEIMITTASIGTKKERNVFIKAVNDVVGQMVGPKSIATAFWPCHTDPCLQLTDYCTWAIQRKWERDDTRSYDLIKDRIRYEYNLWERGTTHYY